MISQLREKQETYLGREKQNHKNKIKKKNETVNDNAEQSPFTTEYQKPFFFFV